MKPRQPSSERLNFARNFAHHRCERRVTFSEIQRTTGLTPSFVGGVAKGRRNLSIDTAAVLAAAIGVDLAALIQPVPLR
jgi:cyanate lyase